MKAPCVISFGLIQMTGKLIYFNINALYKYSNSDVTNKYTITKDVDGEFHPEVPDILLEQISLSSLRISMVYILSLEPTNLLWKVTSGNTIEAW